MLHVKSKEEGFYSLFQEIKGEAKISLLIIALISSANSHLIYCKWLTQRYLQITLQRNLTHFPAPKFLQNPPII